MSLTLHTIIVSTRPGQIGPSVARWFHEFAQTQGQFDCQLVDLADFNLPLYDEPNHPRQQNYQQAHTRAWSASVAAADAYVFVIPEYNYCPPPSFFNALDYLFNEWLYKPCAFVSYGGVSGGLRSAQVAKQLVTTLKMMPIPEGVTVQMPGNYLDEQRRFKPAEPHENSAKALLAELAKWSAALKPLRP